jgi:serine/threonine-protein kinase
MSGPHKPEDLIGERYKVAGFVGEGGMQFVYAANDQVLQRKVAVKTPKNNSAKKRFERSAIVAARVNHPNVAKTLDYFESEGSQYLIEEFIEGGDLDASLLQKIQFLAPYLVAKIFHHLAKGLAASHHAGVVHRDLKPTNIMVAGGFEVVAVKITDFGIARMADEELTEAALGGISTITSSQTAVGALPYMAPEAIETPKETTYPADIWSLGAMCYELLTGEKPFGAGLPAVKKILEAVSPHPPAFLKANPQFSPLATTLLGMVMECLQRNPKDRPTADQLVERCGMLCYPVTEKLTGVVKTIMHNAWGFITTSDGSDVFFHLNSVYGERVSIGSPVLFSKFQGGGAWRAHPVVLLRTTLDDFF